MIGKAYEFYLANKVDKRGWLCVQSYHTTTQGSYGETMVEFAEKTFEGVRSQ